MTIDPRGPLRKIVKVTEYTGATELTLSCGHVSSCNQIFNYTIGTDARCLACKQPSNIQPVKMPKGTFISERTT